MGAISEIVSVSITANTRTVSRKGFAQPLIFGYHTRFPEAFRIYSEAADMLADGFTTADRVYMMALAFFSQEDRNDTVVIGRASSAFTWGGELTITDATEGAHVKFGVVLEDGSVVEVDYTIPNSATTTTVATAVELLIEALTGINSSAAGAVITITASSNGWIPFFVPAEGETKILGAEFRDTTADQNYSAALAALDLVTGGTSAEWYAVACDLMSSACVQDVAAQIEAMSKIYAAQTYDGREVTSGGVLGAALKAAGYDRTFALFHRRPQQFAACAWLGARLALDPGSATWKFAPLSGVTADVLSSTERGFLSDDNLNFYESTAGLGITREGVMASGEFVDVTQTVDWLTARIQERVFGVLANARKVPMTNKGRDLLVAEVLGQLREGEASGALVPGSSVVRAPDVSTLNPADRAARHFKTIEFSAQIAGAVHKVTVRGTLTV